MSSQARKVLEEALGLPEAERAEVAASLLESLDGAPDAGVDEAWRKEIVRRMEQVRRGDAVLVPWADVKERLRGRGDRGGR